ncbi:MAG: hypothetical protein AAF702_23055 [Chloroflexota bacterium]
MEIQEIKAQVTLLTNRSIADSQSDSQRVLNIKIGANDQDIQAVAENAKVALEAIGFEVVDSERLSLTIKGAKELFEETFQAVIEMKDDTEGLTAEGSTSHASYLAAEKFQIPDELSSLIAKVSLIPSP